jgi:site-specific recombinase XerD
MKKYQKTDCFKSFLSSPIREYLQIKTALKYHIDSIGYALAQFDKYLCIHRISTFERLTSSFFLDWIDEQASQTSPITVVDKICILKGFFDHLVRVELIGQNPTESIPTIKLFQPLCI